MLLKIKCCKCGEMLFIYVYEENKRKATKIKKEFNDKVCCGSIGLKCNQAVNKIKSDKELDKSLAVD